MMNRKFLITLLGVSMVLTACASSGNAQKPTLEAIPTVMADTAIIAEGHLEPIHYAEIAFNTSGVVNEVLMHEGEPKSRSSSKPVCSWRANCSKRRV